jgi:8-oxo-dGTP pyrophosphatase MutT (NUDIX family)
MTGRNGDVEALRAALEARTPVDGREASSIGRMLLQLERLTAPFDEHADPVHVTASAIVVGSRGTVLHRHKRFRRWLQPGGHLEPGEQPAEAAMREAEEETGLVLRHPADGPRLVHVDVHYGGRGHTHLDVRYLLEAEGDPHPGDAESQDVKWFSWDEAIGLADAGLVGALRAVRPG